MIKQEDFKNLINKVKEAENGEMLDLSSGEDLSVALMNLISMEEHLFFTANKTGKSEYLDLLNQVREMRKELLKNFVKDPEGEVWCISKHLLATSMRLMEVGTKSLSKGNKEQAESYFKKSYDLYNLFWGLNLGIINTEEMNKVEKMDDDSVEMLTEKEPIESKGKNKLFEKLGKLVQKAVDCCRE